MLITIPPYEIVYHRDIFIDNQNKCLYNVNKQMFWEDAMIISELDQVMCENRNAELLIQEVYRINPSIKFTILDDMITEHEALVLYNTLCNNNAIGRNQTLVPVFNFDCK